MHRKFLNSHNLKQWINRYDTILVEEIRLGLNIESVIPSKSGQKDAIPKGTLESVCVTPFLKLKPGKRL